MEEEIKVTSFAEQLDTIKEQQSEVPDIEVEQQETIEETELTTEEQLKQLQEELATYKEQSENSTATLSAIVEQKKKAVSEGVMSLMPRGLDLTAQVQWLEKAEKVGQPKEEMPTREITEIGRAIPVDVPHLDPTALSAVQKIANGLDARHRI